VRASAADIVTLADGSRAGRVERANRKTLREENADEASSSPEVRSSGFGRVFGRIPDDGL